LAVYHNQPKSAESKHTTIEVIILTRPPQGWDNVPLVGCIGLSGKIPDEDTVCERLTSDDTITEAEAGHSMQLSPRRPHFSKRSLCLGKPRSETASDTGIGICKIAESLENFIRRRNAMTEMYACIREQRQSRFKTAATAYV
jgi:hypothetical protein